MLLLLALLHGAAALRVLPHRLCMMSASSDKERLLAALWEESSSELETGPNTIEPSHMHLELDDETGEPVLARFTYVDEHSCIGCTYCATTARSTFFMEDDHGRARVFNQAGDSEELVQEAIDSCPVNCIHYVSHEVQTTPSALRKCQKGKPT